MSSCNSARDLSVGGDRDGNAFEGGKEQDSDKELMGD